jgi:hypothetical protein
VLFHPSFYRPILTINSGLLRAHKRIRCIAYMKVYGDGVTSASCTQARLILGSFDSSRSLTNEYCENGDLALNHDAYFDIQSPWPTDRPSIGGWKVDGLPS